MDIDMWLDYGNSVDDEILDEVDDKLVIFQTMMVVCADTWDFSIQMKQKKDVKMQLITTAVCMTFFCT